MSILAPFSSSLRPARACSSCLRLFSTSGRKNDGATTNQISALLQGLNGNKNNSASASRTQTQVHSPTGSLAGLANDAHKTMATQLQSIAAARQREERSPAALADIQRAIDRRDLERMLPRRWKSGQAYAPHDLSGVEANKWRQSEPKGKPKKDVFDMLRINPLDHYKNFAMMSDFMTEMGRIKHNKETGLRPVNQRKMAKAVRRAIGLGLMPSVHRHPEILDLDTRRRRAR